MGEYIQQWRAQALKSMEPARQWYAGLQHREQVAVAVLGVAVVLMLLYLLLWKPVLNGRNAAAQRYVAQAQIVDWIADNAAVVREAQRSQNGQPTMQGDWISVINASATQAGLTLRGFTPEGSDAARVQLEQQPFAPVITWLQSLQLEQGVRAAAVEISTGQTPGTVNVRATLRRGS
ncbi:type II secretion system protein GspM [Alcanivorax quisquiliarum]|uniref:Type II secretion system protein M n=1 Tax=Alcanivorax quisquiliarum TaxID=2933565 RepID=A0ABT0E3C9_9GAMM|nr:type II secretion system protein GspM [Alcanivorax quisquiliarum]MCK0536323.1 type II secretion system protein M [Alcanivorax quisquiliarum]